MDWVRITLYVVGLLAVVATTLPMSRTTRWWVRLWDFPRFQVTLVCMAILVAWAITGISAVADWFVIGGVAAALCWQTSWIWPYLPGAPREVADSDVVRAAAAELAVLTANVLQTNRHVGSLVRIILDADADLVLAVEADEWWCSELSDALGARYAQVVRYPLSNGYGLALFSRLKLIDPEVRFVVDESIPSIRTKIELRDGQTVDIYCVHPRPPALLQDSTERDLELVLVGREVRRRGRPAIVVGDLNDVAWSPTTREFARVGGLLDPRRGRGFYNTYPARLPGLRYPLDYVFTTPHFGVATMQVLPRFGSDHLPLLARFQVLSDAPIVHTN